MEFFYRKIEKSDPEIYSVYRLRYQVYCHECCFEDPKNYPTLMEKDFYDDFSTHFGIFAGTLNELIGTVRLVLPFAGSFPIETNMQIDRKLLPNFDPQCVGEISRLAISKTFRKRLIDKALYSENTMEILTDDFQSTRRNSFESQLVAGLYQCIYLESVERGLTHWYAAMARGLYCLLRRWGVGWQAAGPEMEYHGLRGPYISCIADNVAMAKNKYPAMLTEPCGWNGAKLSGREHGSALSFPFPEIVKVE